MTPIYLMSACRVAVLLAVSLATGFAIPGAVPTLHAREAATSGALDPQLAVVVDSAVQAGAVSMEIRREAALDRTAGLLGTRWRLFVTGLGDPIALDPAAALLPTPAAPRVSGFTDQLDAQKRLVSRTDARGNAITITYDRRGRPTQVAGPKGSSFALTLDANGRVTAIRSSTGREVAYTYAGQDLVEVRVDRGAPIKYAYGAAAGPTRVDDPRTGVVDIAYDAQHRVVSYRWADGATQRFEFDDAQGIERRIDPGGAVTTTRRTAGRVEVVDARNGKSVNQIDPKARTMSVTTPDGATTRTLLDGTGRMVAIVDATGATTRFEYEPQSGRVSAVVRPDGTRQEFTYDAAGSLLSERVGATVTRAYTYNPDGTIATRREPGRGEERLAYTKQGWLQSITNAAGGVTRFEYDVRGNVVRETNPLGGVTARTFDPQGRVTSVTGPAGGITKYRYDARGLLVEAVDALGATTKYEYDARGRVIREIDPAQQSTRSEYDLAGRLARVTRPDGATDVYEYDAAGNVVQLTSAGLRTTYEYDLLGRLIAETSPAGLRTQYRYDAAGHRLRTSDNAGVDLQYQTDALGRVTSVASGKSTPERYTYDAAGRLAAVTDPLGRSRDLSYTPEGWLASVRLPSGDEGRYVYDAAGRLTQIAQPSGGTVSLGYDAAGNLTSVADATGAQRRFTYDAAGRRTSAVDALNQTTKLTYDAAGRIATRTLPDGTTIRVQYDPAGRITAVDDGRSAVRYVYGARDRALETTFELPSAGGTRRPVTIRSAYDDRGLRTQLTTSAGAAIHYEYTPAGQLTGAALPDGTRLQFRYDARDRLVGITYPNGVTGTVQYDADGRLSRIAYVDRSKRAVAAAEYRYDAASNPVERRDQQNVVSRFAYDSAGQVTEETTGKSSTRYRYGRGGQRVAVERDGATSTYAYGAGDRLTHVDTTVAPARGRTAPSPVSEAFTYNARGELTGRKSGTVSTAYEYDAQGQLTRVATAGGTVEYSYAPTGERLLRRDASGTTYFVYDGLDLLHELGEDLKPRTTYVYAPGIDRPVAMVRGGETYFFHADRNGSILALTDARGRVVANYDYDAFGNARVRKESIAQPFGYTGREFDGATNLYYYRARYYDPSTGRFISPDSIVQLEDPFSLNPYLYVRNSPVRFVDPLGLAPEWLTGDPTILFGADPNGQWRSLGEQIEWYRMLKGRGPSNPGYEEAVRRLRFLEPEYQRYGPNVRPFTEGEMVGRELKPAPRPGGQGPGAGARRVGPPVDTVGPGSGPGSAPRAAPPTAPQPSAQGSGVGGPLSSPAGTGGGIRQWINNPANAPKISIIITAAQFAACVAQATGGNFDAAAQCIASIAVSQGIAIGTHVVIAYRYGPAAAGGALRVVGVIGLLGWTAVQLGQATYEAIQAHGAMAEADQNALILAQQFQQQAQRIRADVPNTGERDRQAVRTLIGAERELGTARDALDGAERGLSSLPAPGGACEEAARLRTRVDDLKRSIESNLTEIQRLLREARLRASNCRTAEGAAEIRSRLSESERRRADVERDLEEARRAKERVMTLIPRLSPLTSLPEIEGMLTEADRALQEADRLLKESSAAAKSAITTGPADLAERSRRLIAEIDAAEKRYNDLSWQEWIVDLFPRANRRVKEEFETARSLARGAVANVPDARAGDTDILERFGRAVQEYETQRRRHSDLVSRARARQCNITGWPDPDPLDSMRRSVEDARIELDRNNDLSAKADACAPGTNTPDRPNPPADPPRSDPRTPTDKVPGALGPGEKTPSDRSSGNPGRGGGGGVTYDPGPPPVLKATLDCGPVLELRQGASKICDVIVTGWRSNTATPVRLDVTPDLRAGGVSVSPGSTSNVPANMGSPAASNYPNRYVFHQGFTASQRAAVGNGLMVSIVVSQEGHGSVALPLAINVIPRGAPDGSSLSPIGTIREGTGGSMCVFRYKTFGDPPECWSFVAGSCANSRYADPQYERVGQNLTSSQASAVVDEMSRYYGDAFACSPVSGAKDREPIPPAVVTTGKGGDLCVWRYKLFGDPPRCFHVAVAQCGRYGPPYELIGVNMGRGEAGALADQVSRYYNDELGCNASQQKPPPPPQRKPDPPTIDPDPPVRPPTPPIEPEIRRPPARTLTRFGISPRDVTINAGESVTLRAYGVWSDAPNQTVDMTNSVQWSPSNRIATTAADAGRSFTVTATHPFGSDSVTVRVDAPPAPPIRPPTDNVPTGLGGRGGRPPTDNLPPGIGGGGRQDRPLSPPTDDLPPGVGGGRGTGGDRDTTPVRPPKPEQKIKVVDAQYTCTAGGPGGRGLVNPQFANRVRGFSHGNEVNVQVPFTVSSPGGEIRAAKLVIVVMPLEELTSTDTASLQGASGKGITVLSGFSNMEHKVWNTFEVGISDPDVLAAIRQGGQIEGLVQDDTAVKSVQLCIAR